ncbi:MAG: hypothetical protein CM1200mP6_06840 [Anaerolineaceae bacterium]|nr:MAG: hypothetical protein CM1200mP6_06840 [Anaerolineaceae bacterium]
MNNAIMCLDQAYSAFYNPFIQSHQAYEELILPLWDESISDEDGFGTDLLKLNMRHRHYNRNYYVSFSKMSF